MTLGEWLVLLPPLHLPPSSSPLPPPHPPTWCHSKCGGCTRAHGESKPFALTISGREGVHVVLAAANEEGFTQWMQALCEAGNRVGAVSVPFHWSSFHTPFPSQTSPAPVYRRTCLSCAVLLTQNNVCLH